MSGTGSGTGFRWKPAGFLPALALFALCQTASGADQTSLQTPIARITMVEGEAFKVEMMPAEPKPRLIKKGDPNYAAYKAAYGEMQVGDRIHVTTLPPEPKIKPKANAVTPPKKKSKKPHGPVPASIGVATMDPSGVIKMQLRSEDHGMIAEAMKIVRPGDPITSRPSTTWAA